MIDFTDTSFYDKESGHYSARRYEGTVFAYIQYFFRRRLNVVADLIRSQAANTSGLTLIEDGCADGVVLREIVRKFPGRFSHVIGTDISPRMIDMARDISPQKEISYFVKNELPVNT